MAYHGGTCGSFFGIWFCLSSWEQVGWNPKSDSTSRDPTWKHHGNFPKIPNDGWWLGDVPKKSSQKMGMSLTSVFEYLQNITNKHIEHKLDFRQQVGPRLPKDQVFSEYKIRVTFDK